MNYLTFYIRPHYVKTIKLMDRLRGNTSKSEFILQSIQYMIDTHVKHKDILSPLDLPTLADDWEIWQMHFKDLKLGNLVDNIRKLFKDWDGLLKNTLVIKTGSGGYHVYIHPKNDKFPPKMPLSNSSGQHIDIQSDGSYVIGPGSIHPNGNKYEIISTTNELIDFDIMNFLQYIKQFGFNTEYGGLKRFEDIAKGGLGSGERNNNAFKYAINLLENVEMDSTTAWTEVLRWNKTNSPPMDERELRATFESALKKYVGKVGTPVTESETLSLKLMREISATDEGKTISFYGFIAATDEHRTITKSLKH